MKKIVLFFLLFFLLLTGGTIWLLFGSSTGFIERSKTFVIQPGNTDEASVLQTLQSKNIIQFPFVFQIVANQLNLWKKIKPGKYEVTENQNIISIIQMLRKNKQVEVKLVINKIRTKEDFAHLISKNFSTDSSDVIDFLNNPDSLKAFNLDQYTWTTCIIPDTYIFYWSTPLGRIMRRLHETSQAFWNRNNRLELAKAHNLTPKQAYTIASIVEEETNKEEEKGNIASVYINRYRKGMFLGADPTIKFALKNFGLRRILFGHLNVASPYNTYKNQGLPPGPICTPSGKTIDAVLNSPNTNYLFFVANSTFDGHHHFSSTFAEHSQYAKAYQKALNEYLARKKEQE